MWETLITVASGTNNLINLYKNISAVVRGEKNTGHGIEQMFSELERLRIQVERLSEHILYVPALQGIKDLTQPSQQTIQNLREVREYLDPIQQALRQDIISSGMIATPRRLLQAMQKTPWNVLDNIRPVRHTETPTNPALVPVLFQDSGISYIGWTTRGALPGMFDCEYNELWLPNLKYQSSKQAERSLSSDLNQEASVSKRKVIPYVSTSMQYGRLQKFLSEKLWRDADQETRDLLLLAGRGQEFTSTFFASLNCSALSTINELWLRYSDGHFGFSIQKLIYNNSTQSSQNINRFCQRVGWFREGIAAQVFLGSYRGYSDLTFSLASPKGHLPAAWIWDNGFSIIRREKAFLQFIQRLTDCSI